MHRQRRQFPLIPDGESCLQEPISMRLYENEDLITNIRGPYQDKDYNDFFLNHDFLSAKPSNRKQAPKRVETQEAGMTYAEEAREKAKRDVREKRQKFLRQEVQQTKHTNSRQLTAKPKVEAKPSFEATVEPAAVTTDKGPVTASILGAPVSAIKRTLAPNGKHSKIHHLANRLKQDTYILAEVAPTYQQPSNPSRKNVKKNSYDFLKRSQVYNYTERQIHREHRIAQELNLTHLEDAN